MTEWIGAELRTRAYLVILILESEIEGIPRLDVRADHCLVKNVIIGDWCQEMLVHQVLD